MVLCPNGAWAAQRRAANKPTEILSFFSAISARGEFGAGFVNFNQRCRWLEGEFGFSGKF